LFQGESYLMLDEKSRVTVPAKFRTFINPEDQQKGFILTHLPYEDERCIRMFTPSEWVQKVDGLRKMADEEPNPESFLRLMMAHTETVDMDSQFRILVPQRLLTFANLERGSELVMVGALNHIQLWNKQYWQETVDRDRKQVQDRSKDVRKLMNGIGPVQ
jgi:MraZ protein